MRELGDTAPYTLATGRSNFEVNDMHVGSIPRCRYKTGQCRFNCPDVDKENDPDRQPHPVSLRERRFPSAEPRLSQANPTSTGRVPKCTPTPNGQ